MTAARFLALAGLLLTSALYAADKPADKDTLPADVSFYKDVRPIFQQHCNGCHQPAKPSGGFVMTATAELLKKGESDKPGIVPGKPDASNLVSQITPHDGKKPLMPRNLPPLLDREVALVKKWIAQGAKDDTPVSDRVVIDMEHPPTYLLPPVIATLAYSPDGCCTRRTAPASSPGSSARRSACSRSPSAPTASTSPWRAARRPCSARCKSGTWRSRSSSCRIQ
jgi:mono/diheme cytochrome c family protein